MSARPGIRAHMWPGVRVRPGVCVHGQWRARQAGARVARAWPRVRVRPGVCVHDEVHGEGHG